MSRTRGKQSLDSEVSPSHNVRLSILWHLALATPLRDAPVIVRYLVALAGIAFLGCSSAQDASANQAKSNRAMLVQREFPAKPESVTDPIEIKSTTAAFDRHLMSLGQRVGKCDHIVRIQIGKSSRIYGRGLAAYGAYCTLGNRQPVALCYEEAVGRFALVADAFFVERGWIEKFTLQTCATLD